MVDIVLSLTIFITSLKDLLLSILPFLISIGILWILLGFRALLRWFIENIFLKFSKKEKRTKKILLIIWHSIWFLIIFLLGFVGLFISFSKLDEADTPKVFSKLGGLEIALVIITIGYLLILYRTLRTPIKDILNIKEIEKSKAGDVIKIWDTVCLIIILTFGIIHLSTYFATFGLSAAVIAALLGISFQTPLKGIAGWSMLMVRKTFQEGHRVKIGNIKGDVDSINLMSVILKNTNETKSGKVYIPNSTLFDQAIINYTKPSSDKET